MYLRLHSVVSSLWNLLDREDVEYILSKCWYLPTILCGTTTDNTAV